MIQTQVSAVAQILREIHDNRGQSRSTSGRIGREPNCSCAFRDTEVPCEIAAIAAFVSRPAMPAEIHRLVDPQWEHRRAPGDTGCLRSREERPLWNQSSQ